MHKIRTPNDLMKIDVFPCIYNYSKSYMINNKTNILMDRLSDEEFLEFMYHIKRILNSSVKTNVEKTITMSQLKLLTSTAPAATTVAIVPL